MEWALALPLVPLCAVLNYLGGQSTLIPHPRVICRIIGISFAFYLSCMIAGATTIHALIALFVGLGGLTLWAVPHWGDGFMCIPPYTDHRNYKKLPWICWICDRVCDVKYFYYLSPLRAREWGIVYFTVRGFFMFPLFLCLALLFNPMILSIGTGCLLQGLVYAHSKTVAQAECLYGAVIGTMLYLAVILIAIS